MRVAFIILAFICSLAQADEIQMWIEKNGNRVTLEDSSVRDLGGGLFWAWGYIYTAGQRSTWTYMVAGCAAGYGSVFYGLASDNRDPAMYYWTRQGGTNGDGIARFICLRSIGKPM